MTAEEALQLIRGGESMQVEFKKSTNEITKDVYDTVCSFSNREGGHIFLGVKDNGTVLGIAPDAVEHIKKEFVTTVNNSSKMYPPIYLTPEEISIDGAVIIHIYVPVGTQVCRCGGKSLTAATKRIWILQTIPMRSIGCMRASRIPTM